MPRFIDQATCSFYLGYNSPIFVIKALISLCRLHNIGAPEIETAKIVDVERYTAKVSNKNKIFLVLSILYLISY